MIEVSSPEIYAGSWNSEQMMPHREQLVDYLESSLEYALKGEKNPWTLVTVGSYEQVGKDLTYFEQKVTK